jgi:hypothetical protein
MSAERDRMRRILGIDLADAGRQSGVTGPIERRRQPEVCDFELASSDVLYFRSFDQYLTWLDAEEQKLRS